MYSTAIQGFAAHLTFAQAQTLANDPRVAQVVPDQTVEIADGWRPDDAADGPPATIAELRPPQRPTRANSQPPADPPHAGSGSQIVPTGVERVGRPSLDGARLNGDNEKADMDIAIVDTGVSDHPDLNVVGGVDCTGSRSGWDDQEGHGTHVAGTAAAKDNDFGVVGVAPGRASGRSRCSTRAATAGPAGCCAASTGSPPNATVTSRSSRSPT